jgi:membrane-associated phospholipid phosphatase
MIMALLAMQAWSWNRALRLPVFALNFAVMFTTLPMGGHYFVDLAGGALVWLVWSAIADAIVKGRSPRVKPAAPVPA